MATLQVSVIEGRNLNIASEAGDPYVKLQFQGQEVQTAGVKGMATQAGVMHKWLKDFKLLAPQPGGDLEVFVKCENTTLGAITIPVDKVGETGTQVDWHKVMDKGVVTGEVCLVLRIIRKGTSSPGKSGSPRRVERTKSPTRATMGRTPDPSPHVFPESPPPLPLNPAAVRGEGDTRGTQAANPVTPKSGRTSTGRTSFGNTTPRASKRRTSTKQSDSKGVGILSKLPFVGLVVAAIGAITMLSNKSKYYEVQEGDTFCALGICFNKNVKGLISRNPQVVDPNRLFPGDRIRID
mmetsp:Transcript_14252/g.19650  ORF Transcript_14252/g.19650 Transcript_14252/m.19650 type:complete len:294 (+) Transcript_14252:136-1017(+)|eukprot:CAMPEP_0196573972 /NCGR_PEP_ID=MMETSP1081-20130531/3779_1 /TAXON_ID=36882 /ORGANISM="Pyramimonas amylifera, Strain CCMP720" /LENGTH=293 /DNA_ID=CAMNT_0041891853 /DNA_START=129 /DNA_END=1010 /DNA_ORIENTATION=-